MKTNMSLICSCLTTQQAACLEICNIHIFEQIFCNKSLTIRPHCTGVRISTDSCQQRFPPSGKSLADQPEFYFNFPKLVFNCHNLSRSTCTLIQIVVVCTGNHLALYLKLTKSCIFGQHILLDFILLVLEICFSQKAKQRQVRNSQNPFQLKDLKIIENY